MSLTCSFRKRPVHRGRTHGLGQAGRGRPATWVRVSFEAVESVLELGQGDECPALCVLNATELDTLKMAEMVNCMSCEFYHDKIKNSQAARFYSNWRKKTLKGLRVNLAVTKINRAVRGSSDLGVLLGAPVPSHMGT